MSEMKCPTCGESEPGTGNCGTSDSDTKALCKVQPECSCRNESQECTEASNCRVLKMFEPTITAVAVDEQFAVLIKKANDQAEHFEREWYLRGDELEALEQVNAQLLEALKELMYARTDKAEGMAEAAIAQAEAAKKGVGVRFDSI